MVHSYRSLEAEEAATLSFFAEALFDEMQESAAAVIRREESRPIDAYTDPAATALSGLPVEDYIRGYFQNNPDGSFQAPHRIVPRADAKEPALRQAELEEANRVFNRKRAEGTDRIRPEVTDTVPDEKRKDQAGFAGRYLDQSRAQRSKSYLGERDNRLETVTPGRRRAWPNPRRNRPQHLRWRPPAGPNGSDRRRRLRPRPRRQWRPELPLHVRQCCPGRARFRGIRQRSPRFSPFSSTTAGCSRSGAS